MSLCAGFDLGGTRLKYGLIDAEGRIVFFNNTATPPTIEKLLHLLKKIW